MTGRGCALRLESCKNSCSLSVLRTAAASRVESAVRTDLPQCSTYLAPSTFGIPRL